MHIVHVITSLYPGGAQSALCRLCIHDPTNRHTVVTMIGGGDYETLLEEHGISVSSLWMEERSKKGLLRAAARLWRLLRKVHPDLVQTWMYHPDLLGGLCARLAGIRVCWGIRHTTLESGSSARSTMVIARLCAWLSAWIPCRIICCAQQAANIHEDLGYAHDKTLVIPNGYDLSAFQPFGNISHRRSVLDQFRVDGVPLLGMVGRFNAQKDHETLLTSLALLKTRGHEFRCLLVGGGLDESNPVIMKSLSLHGLTSHVKLLGLRSDIAEVMNGLDLHILSSSFGEAFPNVIAEAMACGTPCVATDVGDTALIIGNTGWVVPPRDPERLADAITEALLERERYPSLWHQRQQSAVEQIRNNFTIDKMVVAFDSVWLSCIDSRE